MEKDVVENQTVDGKGRDKKSRFGWMFLAVLLFSGLIAAGLLVLWAWISYRARYSVSVIRSGLTLIYILPCLLGGRLLRITRKPGLPLWGALLGCSFFGLLCLCTFLAQGGKMDFDGTNIDRKKVFYIMIIDFMIHTIK